jgi:hypothetical protein
MTKLRTPLFSAERLAGLMSLTLAAQYVAGEPAQVTVRDAARLLRCHARTVAA